MIKIIALLWVLAISAVILMGWAVLQIYTEAAINTGITIGGQL